MTKYKYGNPEAPIVLIQPVGDHDLPEIEGEVAQIRKLTALDFQMIAVKVDDWNLDLSPWRSPAVFGKEDFGGGAASLLEEILRLCPDEGKTYYLGEIDDNALDPRRNPHLKDLQQILPFYSQL